MKYHEFYTFSRKVAVLVARDIFPRAWSDVFSDGLEIAGTYSALLVPGPILTLRIGSAALLALVHGGLEVV